MAFDNLYRNKILFSNGQDLINLIQNHTDSDPNIVRTTGDQTINGNKTFSNDIIGTALKAKYADLAEYYIADNNYDPGTLVEFGGRCQITIAKDKVNAVVSTDPGFVLNTPQKDQEDNTYSLPIALCGQVYIKVKGKVDKFNKIKLDPDTPGVGIVTLDDSDDYIARALETKFTNKVGNVLCVTAFNIK